MCTVWLCSHSRQNGEADVTVPFSKRACLLKEAMLARTSAMSGEKLMGTPACRPVSSGSGQTRSGDVPGRGGSRPSRRYTKSLARRQWPSRRFRRAACWPASHRGPVVAEGGGASACCSRSRWPAWAGGGRRATFWSTEWVHPSRYLYPCQKASSSRRRSTRSSTASRSSPHGRALFATTLQSFRTAPCSRGKALSTTDGASGRRLPPRRRGPL